MVVAALWYEREFSEYGQPSGVTAGCPYSPSCLEEIFSETKQGDEN